MNSQIVQLLLGTYLFGDLTPAEVAPLARAATVRLRGAGDAVYRPGDAADNVYVVRSGSLREVAVTADGDELTLEVVADGDLFGEVGIFASEQDRIVGVVTITDCELITLSRAVLVPYLFEHPPAMMRLLEALVAMTRETVELAATMAFTSIKDRVALRMAELADLHGRPHINGTLIEMPLPQVLIASLAGASRANVNRAISALESEGTIIRVGRRYIVPDPQSIRLQVAGSQRLLYRRNRP